jgi:penicillin amidase
MARVVKKYGPEPSDYRWGKIHYIKFYSLLGIGPGDVLSVGPFPHLGADQTVRMAKAAGFGKDPYKTLMGPCLRHIMDLGDPDHALLVIDGSESGQWLSPHYDDMHKLWLNSEYATAVMDADEVKASAESRLLLVP